MPIIFQKISLDMATWFWGAARGAQNGPLPRPGWQKPQIGPRKIALRGPIRRGVRVLYHPPSSRAF